MESFLVFPGIGLVILSLLLYHFEISPKLREKGYDTPPLDVVKWSTLRKYVSECNGSLIVYALVVWVPLLFVIVLIASFIYGLVNEKDF